MNNIAVNTRTRHLLFPILLFFAVLALTQYLAYQQYTLIKSREKEILLNELSSARDRFNNILDTDGNKANTVSILYNEIGMRKDFGDIVYRILETNKSIDLIQIVSNNIITHVYPLQGNEKLLGRNSEQTQLQKDEFQKAVARKDIYFAGPRKLTQGGYAILGKMPIYKNDKLEAFCVLLTNLSTIKKALHITNDKSGIFCYVLAKKDRLNRYQDFKLNDNLPNKDTFVESAEIPEGDWLLKVSYSQNFEHNNSYFIISGFGFLLSLLSSGALYRRAGEKNNLRLGIREKTHLLDERIKELSTIYQVNSFLTDKSCTIEEMLSDIAKVLPEGCRFPEMAAAKITFEQQEFYSENYQESKYCQIANFQLTDARKGSVNICYAEDQIVADGGNVFSSEEIRLLMNIAKKIENHLNSILLEATINQSEKQFRDAFEKAAIGMGIVALDGAWLVVNKSLCEMLGYTEKELLSLNFQQITHPEDLESDLQYHKQLINGESDSYGMEKRYIHKNRSTVWIHLNVVPVKNQNNQVIYLVAQIENISQRVESETKFKDLVEKSHVGVFILKDNVFLYVNPMIIQKFGYTEDELIGSPSTNFIYEEDIPKILQNLQERNEGKTDKLNYEVRLRKKDGSLIWAEVFSSNTIYNGELAIIGTIIDRTEEKLAHIELQKSEANLKTIFNATEVSYLLTDKNLNVVASNSHFNELFIERTGKALQTDINLEDQSGKLPQEAKSRMKDVFQKVFDEKVSIEYEEKGGDYENIKASKYYQFMISPVVNNGEVIGACMAVINITIRKNLELENQKIIADLSQRNRDLEQFSYILSHNIRIPISNLLGLIQMLDHEISEEDQAFVMDSFKQSVTALDDVVEDVNHTLSLRKNILEAKTNVKLKIVLNEVQAELKENIYKTNAKISFDFSEVDNFDSISPYVHSIFLNLISNSLKFTSPERTPEIKIWTEKKDENILIHFEDNGIGIDLEKNGMKIFGLYKRFDLARAGKGMGLFLTKAQINALQGHISVVSELDKGTHFTVSLPA